MALTAPSSTLTGQTIAASYDQVLFLDAAAGVTEATLKIVSGTAGKTALSISDEHVLVKGVDTNNAAGFEVQQTDGTSILKIAAGTPSATLIGALTVGVDGTGHDVIFYGDTANGNMTWDQSEDDLVLNDARLFVDQDVATVDSIVVDTEATSAHGLTIAGDALTTGSAGVFSTSCVNLATTVSGGLVEISSTGDTDTNVNNLLFVKNDHADSSKTIGIYVQQDSTEPAISATGGIVEQGGTLKENLLTNSGFDVWSNSTLVNMGSDLVTGGDFTGGASGWTLETGWSASSNHLVSTSGGYNNAAYRSITTVVGKLYRVSITCDGHTDGSVAAWTNAQSVIGNVLTDAGISTVTFEATGTSTAVGAIIKTAGSDFTADNFTCFEVTPGCEGADVLGPDGWSKQSGMRVYRKEWIDVGHASNTVYSKDGSFYGLYCPTSDSADKTFFGGIRLDTSGREQEIKRFLGRKITVGAWVYAKASSHASISVNDNVNGSSTATHSGSAGWEWLEVTHTVATNATTLYSFRLTSALKAGTATDPPSTNDDEIWMSQPMLVFGSSIGSGNYTRPQGEVVWLEYYERLNVSTAPVAADDTILNLEALSDGKVPKGAKAVYVKSQIQDSSVTTNNGIYFSRDSSGQHNSLNNYPSVSAMRTFTSGWVACDTNGDIYQTVTNSTGTLSNHYIDVMGVELY